MELRPLQKGPPSICSKLRPPAEIFCALHNLQAASFARRCLRARRNSRKAHSLRIRAEDAVGTPIADERMGRSNNINKELPVSYLVPSEFVTKMVDAGEAKIFMSTRDTVLRAYM